MTERDLLQELYVTQKLSVQRVANRLGVSRSTALRRLQKHGFHIRSHAEAMALRRQRRFRYDARGKEALEIAALCLFWAEGTRFKKRVEITNADPEVIKLFLRFLREVCNVEEGALRCRIQLHDESKYQKALHFWSQATGIPISQFMKRFLKPNKGGKPKHPLGIVSVYCNDTELYEELTSRIVQIPFMIP